MANTHARPAPKMPPETPTADPPEPGASWFVWGLWGAMLAANLVFVLRFGPLVPLVDDHAIIPALTGDQPITPAWLWSQHNEHRIPLPRLVLLAAYAVSGNDFRAGMVVSVFALGMMAASLIGVARQLRKNCRYADALFPLFLMSWGHHNNLLWSWQVAFTVAMTVLTLLATLIARAGPRAGPWTWFGIGLALALLPLFGAHGLAFVPGVSAWLIGLSIARTISGDPRGWSARLSPMGAALPGLLLTAFYFVGYKRPDELGGASDLGALGRTALQFVAMGLGPFAAESWPIASVIVLTLAASAFVLLFRGFLTRPEERFRAFGLAALLAGFAPLTLGTAWGRANLSPLAGLEPRYVGLMALVPCLAFVVWTLYGPPVLRRFLGMILLALGFVLLWPNMRIGLEAGRDWRANSEAVVADIRSGLPPFLIIRDHTPWLHPSHDVLADSFAKLGRAGIGPFQGMATDPPLRELPLPIEPTNTYLARFDASTGTIEATGVDPWVLFRLPEPRRVVGLRLGYDHDNGAGTSPWFKLGWKRPDQASFPIEQHYQRWTMPTGEDRTLTAWIGETVSEIRIQPDNRPCRFRINELVLLVPEGN
ncbi:hypothetical protein BH23PLA1_BH23PLA1_40620 [soil metagenome]